MQGGQLKGDGEGGWPMQLAKSDAIFMDFIWPSSNEINSSPPFLKVLWGPQVFRLVEVYICCTQQKRWTHLLHNHIISKHAWDKHQFGYQNWIANYKIWTKNSLRWQTHLVSLSLNSRVMFTSLVKTQLNFAIHIQICYSNHSIEYFLLLVIKNQRPEYKFILYSNF